MKAIKRYCTCVGTFDPVELVLTPALLFLLFHPVDPAPVKTEVDVAFAISTNSVNYMQTFRLMKDTISWIIGRYGTDKLRYSVILFGADANTELNFDENVSTPNKLIQFVQSLSRRSGGPDLNKALDEAKKVFESAGARPGARKVDIGIFCVD